MYSLARICTFVGLVASSAMAIVLPSLSAWTELHTNALINAQTIGDLDTAADAFLSQNISIVVNGASLTRSQFLQLLAVNLPRRLSSNVSYTAIIEDPTDPSNPTAVRLNPSKRLSVPICLTIVALGRMGWRLLGIQQLLLQPQPDREFL